MIFLRTTKLKKKEVCQVNEECGLFPLKDGSENNQQISALPLNEIFEKSWSAGKLPKNWTGKEFM